MSKVKFYSIPSQMDAYSEENDSNLMKVRFKFNKTGKNYNYTKFGKDALVKAEQSLSNIPILAYVKCTDEELDEYDFDGHNVATKIVESSNGYKVTYKYLERPIGVIPESNNVSYEETDDGEEYCLCDGYIWKCYANEGYDILKKAESKSVSMEIRMNDGVYDEEDDFMDITDFEYLGITVLGDDVNPAIEGACVTKYSTMNSYKRELQELYEAIYKFEKEGENAMEGQEPVVEQEVQEEPVVEQEEPVVEPPQEPSEPPVQEPDEPQDGEGEEPVEPQEEPKVDYSRFSKLLDVDAIEDEDGLFVTVEKVIGTYAQAMVDLQQQVADKDAKLEEMSTELERLQKLEADIKAEEQREAVYSIRDKYQGLLEADFSELTSKAELGEMDLADYEKELALMFSKEFMNNKSKFSANEEPRESEIQILTKDTSKVESVYGDVSQYLK